MRRALLVVTLISAGCWAGKSDPIGEIAAHKWWKQPPSRAQVEKLVQTIVDANSGSVVYFNNDGTCVVRKPGDSSFGTSPLFAPKGVNEPYGYIAIEGDSRFTVKEACRAIMVALDKLEFEDGPGSKRKEPVGGTPDRRRGQ